jgi:hypothetical protein
VPRVAQYTNSGVDLRNSSLSPHTSHKRTQRQSNSPEHHLAVLNFLSFLENECDGPVCDVMNKQRLENECGDR